MYRKKIATAFVIAITAMVVANSGEVPNANGVTANGPAVSAAPPLVPAAAPALPATEFVAQQRVDELAWSRGRIAELEATVKELQEQIKRLTDSPGPPRPEQKQSQAPVAYTKPQQFRAFSSCGPGGCGQSSGSVFGGGGGFRPFGGVFRRR